MPRTTGGGKGTAPTAALGLPAASALVIGSIIGTGVFALPSALAPYGPISLVAFVAVTLGALALALTFGALSKRVPTSGGPYVYAREAFGEFAGFLNAWSYWITAWAGNAAIVVAWVGYVEVFVNTGHHKWISVLLALVGLWIPAAINLTGVRNTGAFQVITTVLKFVPLVFMATVGLLFIDTHNFGPFNASGQSVVGAISAAGAIALFSYLGLEAASVVAGRVREPGRNVPRATVYGTLICALIYILGTLAVFGTVAHGKLGASTAPFTDAANNIFGGTWAGDIVAVAAIISGIGALNGWTMLCAEMPYAAARDGLFPRAFARLRGENDVPAFGILASTALASLITVFSYTRFDDVFTKIVLLSVVTAVIPYLFSAAAQLYWLLVRGSETLSPRRLARDVTVAALALAFSYWSIQGSGYQTVYYGLFVLLLGVPVYVWLKRGQGAYGESTVTQTSQVDLQPERAPETPPPARRSQRGPRTNRVGPPQQRMDLRHHD
ncbi:amino acid permease [Streptomyces pluripotens]|uniref:Amino acid permease n=1 Tax=Streptomyces pluripotens TaxID=1355015 RepID=A0A221P6B0_9ACTN|nr:MULTISPECIES: amino acid permease [Streptomyces]ARP73378.1 amino acid permease [Streptomyces pluripotens]ASN27626.1 amino acid permease [Streptomyces pluripotens]MCH0560306.1 amino acid permease [Streptomyces sp. MUM 16J]